MLTNINISCSYDTQLEIVNIKKKTTFHYERDFHKFHDFIQFIQEFCYVFIAPTHSINNNILNSPNVPNNGVSMKFVFLYWKKQLNLIVWTFEKITTTTTKSTEESWVSKFKTKTKKKLHVTVSNGIYFIDTTTWCLKITEICCLMSLITMQVIALKSWMENENYCNYPLNRNRAINQFMLWLNKNLKMHHKMWFINEQCSFFI